MFFDAHSDILSDVTNKRRAGEKDILRKYHLNRLRTGKVEGSFFVLWIEPVTGADSSTYAEKHTQEMMECTKAELAECDEVRLVYTYKEIQSAIKEGKFYIMLGVEGMAAIGQDVSKIDWYYDFGCRHAMLTWNEQNALGAGAATGSTEGLTVYGKQAVRYLEEKKMLVDTSHLNEAGFWDIAAMATRPVIASHSNCRKLCDVPRNLTDEQLKAMRDLNGVVGLNAYRGFVSDDPAKQTVDQLARHADHMIEVMGVGHVGCGFDFFEFLPEETGAEGKTPAVADMRDCSETENLIACFDKLGLTKEEQQLIAYGNFHRVIREVLGQNNMVENKSRAI